MNTQGTGGNVEYQGRRRSAGLVFLFLQLAVVIRHELTNLWAFLEQLFPLLFVQGHREPAEPVYRDGALLTDFERDRPAGGGFLQFFVLALEPFDFSLEFFWRLHNVTS